MKKPVVWIIAGIVVIIALLIVFMRMDPLRRRPVSMSPQGTDLVKESGPMLHELPVAQWTGHIIGLQRRGSWSRLAEELAELRSQDPQSYTAWDLSYLEARALGESGEHEQALEKLQPFLIAGDELRPTALYHAARFSALSGDDRQASTLRRMVIAQGQSNPWWRDAITDEVSYLVENATPSELEKFAASIRSSAPSDLRRELDSARVVHRMGAGDVERAWEIAVAIFRGGIGDDAADRAARALDTTDGRRGITAERLRLLGEVAQSHRRYERAIALLAQARDALPQEAEDLTFAIGRSQFGAEDFESAEATYLDGARIAKSADSRSTFLFHASRAAQLRGDDDRAIRHLDAAVAAGGKAGGLSAALTQRMRTHMHRKEWNAARRDLARHAELFPSSDVRAEALTHLAVGRLMAGDAAEAERLLSSTPSSLIDDHTRTEIYYWLGRAAEERDPEQALEHYMTVLRHEYPSHYPHFIRERIRGGALATVVKPHLAGLDRSAGEAEAGGEWETARRHLTDLWHLTGDAAVLERLRAVYAKLPVYGRVAALAPLPLPSLGTAVGDMSTPQRMMAMGLYDDALSAIPTMYDTSDLNEALTQALALGRAGAGRESMLTVETLMRRVPDDYVAEALPRLMQELLYPRYYWYEILERSREHGADPRLVISIMREESRFNPRAKSAAAARGLLQFIITTARTVGQSIGLVELEPDDLYDPDVIIRLGARYVGDLLEEFDGNPYRAAAAYNAGPAQTKLWNRMLPAQENDVFLTFVNFTETKHYVRKVLNSYRNYERLYGEETTGR